MSAYPFTRTILPSGHWDTDHPDRVDGGGAKLFLAGEIEIAIPGHPFTVRCAAGSCVVDFPDYTLTAGEETTLTDTVSDHQNNAA